MPLIQTYEDRPRSIKPELGTPGIDFHVYVDSYYRGGRAQLFIRVGEKFVCQGTTYGATPKEAEEEMFHKYLAQREPMVYTPFPDLEEREPFLKPHNPSNPETRAEEHVKTVKNRASKPVKPFRPVLVSLPKYRKCARCKKPFATQYIEKICPVCSTRGY